jgi:hypothetical protein
MCLSERVFFVVAVLALAGAAGCGSSATTDPSRGNVILRDENNYTTTASLTVPTIETAPATDLDICWPHIVDDLQCHPLSATADLDNVALLRISHLTQEQVERELADGQLAQAQVAGYLDHQTDHSTTCLKLSQLSFFGTAIDVPSEYVESVSYSYLLLFTKGTTPGVGGRAMVFLKPTAESTNTMVDAPTGCGMLAFTADLASLTKASIPAAGPWVVDWRDITRDGQGNAPPFQKIDGVTIGFYEGMTVADLQARILDIELIATSLWDLPLTSGKTADLALAHDRKTGEAFGGFAQANAGTWMLALTCSRCQSPAPVLLTILQPTGSPG